MKNTNSEGTSMDEMITILQTKGDQAVQENIGPATEPWDGLVGTGVV
ncbi:MAG: hypothetical protein ACTSPK_11475 [Candidatus Heimdallarchaeota archaeon]